MPRTSEANALRTVRFFPYIKKGHGPSFTLHTYDTCKTDDMGKSVLGYRLTIRENGQTRVLFRGEDFACSPCYAIDSDECVASLMGFLTLRPGDTDSNYFDAYTPGQLAYAEKHAETLAMAVIDRFGFV